MSKSPPSSFVSPMSNLLQSSTANLPFDPLPKPGVSVDANRKNQSAEPPKPPNGSIPSGNLTETLAQGTDNSSFSAEPKVKRRVVESDSWLPAGWLMEDRVRSSGARVGLVDKYYFDPSSGRKFRSKKEVLYYLETGTPQPKRKKGTEAPGSEEVYAGISPGNKQRKSDKNPKPLNFDFINVPEKVDWLFTNASANSWTPFLGDDQVPESTTQDWAATFTFLTTATECGQAMS